MRQCAFVLAILSVTFSCNLFDCSGLLTRAQHLQQPGPSAQDAMHVLRTEINKGTLLTYHSRFTVDDEDARGAEEERNGTIYAVVDSVSLGNCKLNISFSLYNRFTTKRRLKVGHHVQTGFLGQTSRNLTYAYALTLPRTATIDVALVNGRPSELTSGKELSCVEDPKCDLVWLTFSSASPFAHETRTVQGMQDIDRDVATISFPVSSNKVGSAALSEARQIVASCR